MNYQDLLSYLIKITNTKIGSLAEILSYDISYISKWVHGKRKPSPSNILDINKKLAKVFAGKILDKNLYQLVQKDLGLKGINSKKDALKLFSLEKTIFDYLNLAYKDELVLEKDKDPRLISYIIGHSEIENSLIEIFRHIFSQKKESLDIWVHLSILSDPSNFLINLISNYMNKDQEINLYCLYNRKYVINDVRNIFKKIEKYPNIHFEVYEHPSYENLNFISIKDYFFADISIKDSHMLTMTYSFDKETASKFYLMAKNNLTETNKIITKTNSLAPRTSDFLTSFYSRDRYTVLLNYGFEYLLPDDALNEVFIENKTDELDRAFIHKVNEVIQDFFEISSVNIIIPRDILEAYFSQGYFYFYTHKLKLSQAMVKTHVNNVIRILKKNPRFHIHLLDKDIYEKFPFSNFNVYYNGDMVYFKKILNSKDHSLSSSYSIDSKIFNDILAKDLQSIINDPSTKEIYYYEFRKLYKERKKAWPAFKLSSFSW